MQYNIYFRKDNWEQFKDEQNKSELVNTLLSNYYGTGFAKVTSNPHTNNEIRLHPPEPTYEKVPSPTADKAPKLKVLTNSDLQTLLGGKAAPIKDEPQHGQRHICKDNCKHWIWDANSGKYNNSLTGEVRDAPEF